MSNSKNLNTAVIYGSARRDRHGIKAARFVVRKLEERGHDVTLVDTQEYELPMLDRMYKEYEQGQAPEAMQQIADILNAADGFIVISAEYNHSIFGRAFRRRSGPGQSACHSRRARHAEHTQRLSSPADIQSLR